MVRTLGRADIPVAIVCKDRRANVARSRHCRAVVVAPSFLEDPISAVRAIADWARAQPARPVIFYQGDHDLLALSRQRDLLCDVAHLLLPRASLVEGLAEKLCFAGLAERADLPVPRSRALVRGPSFEASARDWDIFPCVIKPALRSRWFESKVISRTVAAPQKALRVEDRRELEALLPLLSTHESDFLIQAAIEGGEDRIVSYHAYVREDGELAAEFTGRKLRTSPRRYGLSTYVEITDDPAVKRIGRMVVERLGFTGVLKIDMKQEERTNRLYVLEVNARFSLWLHAGAIAGVNIPELVYRDAVEPSRKSVRPRARPGVRWMSLRADLRAYPEHRNADGLTRATWLTQALTASMNEDLTLSDPLPGLLTVAEIVERRVARLVSPWKRRARAFSPEAD